MRLSIFTLLFSLGSIASINTQAQHAQTLLLGEEAPKIEAIDNQGNVFSLAQKIEQGPVVVVFYRGEWCSYCNRHMAALEKALPEFKELRASVVAITPELPKYVKKTVKKFKGLLQHYFRH